MEFLYQVRIHNRDQEGAWGDATLWYVKDGSLFNDNFGGQLEGYTVRKNVHGSVFVAHGAELFIVDLVTDWRNTEFWCSTIDRAQRLLNVFFPRIPPASPFLRPGGRSPFRPH